MNLKEKIANLYVSWKTYLSFKKLGKIPVNLPVSHKEVKNVLVLLPLEDQYMDAALTLIRHLRQYFKNWHFMALDVRKISPEQQDRFGLPDAEFLKELQKNEFQLAIDLNFKHDLRMKYLIGMLDIPHRLHLTFSDANTYNLFTLTREENFSGFHHVLSYLKSSFEV
jgi:hypothetical protein